MTIPLPENYIPTESEEYMSELQLSYFQKRLEDWKKELLDESSQTLNYLKEENFNEPDLNDRASREGEASLDFRKKDRYRKLINKIDAALKRIEDGEYGFCIKTGQKIGIERLIARPIATMSVEAQEEYELAELETKKVS